MAAIWITCPDYTAGPYRDRQAAQRAADRADAGGHCPHAHAITVADVRPVPAWQAGDDDGDDGE
jgi:hypothetical protein